jgi:signal transduction histidine kinase
MRQSTAREYFLVELRRALRHLYDPTVLRHSPLLDLFSLNASANPHAALRRILTEGIQALKPGDDVPPYASAWRIYHILTYRYVEQSSQHTVSANLGLSIRQLRRQERIAERALADYLWSRHNLEATAQRLAIPLQHQPQPNVNLTRAGQEQELEWLRQSLPSETATIGETLEVVLRTAAPLLQGSAVEVQCHVPEGLPPLTGQLSTVRQGLLNLLGAAVRSAPGGQVSIAITSEPAGVRVHVRAVPLGPALPPNKRGVEQLEMARQLIELFGAGWRSPLA